MPSARFVERCGAAFQCRNFKEKSVAHPSERKPLARVKRNAKQSWEGGKIAPELRAVADEGLQMLKSSSENCSVLNYSGGREGN